MTNGMWEGKFYRRLTKPSGIVLVRRDAPQLIDCWAKWYHHDQPLDSIKPLAWFWDQITLVEAHAEAGVACASISMHVYADCELQPGAAIWSAHVGDKKERYYEVFEREYRRQQQQQSAPPVERDR